MFSGRFGGSRPTVRDDLHDFASDIGGAGVLEFVANAAQVRVVNYRAHAEQLREIAKTESPGRLPYNLLTLADQYDDFAAQAEFRRLD